MRVRAQSGRGARLITTHRDGRVPHRAAFIAKGLQKVPYLASRDGVPHRVQLLRELSRALRGPPQRRLRIAPRHGIHECLERAEELGFGLGDGRSPRSWPSDPDLAGLRRRIRGKLLEVTHPCPDPLLSNSRGAHHDGRATAPQSECLSGHPQPRQALIHRWGEFLKSSADLFLHRWHGVLYG